MGRSRGIDLVNVIGSHDPGATLLTPPYGILYVGSALKAAGFPVRLHHILPSEISRTAADIAARRPLFAGVSTFTGLSIACAAAFSKALRRMAPSIPIVWGGIHASLAAEQCLAQNYVDVVVVGEGEATAAELAAALDDGGGEDALASVRGLRFKTRDGVKATPPRPLAPDLDALPLDWSLVDVARYVKTFPDGRRMIDLLTSRGCPFACGFCYNAEFHGRRFRARSAENVLAEVRWLRERYGVTDVSNDDDNFFAARRRALRIVEGMRELGVRLVRADIHLDDIDEEYVSMLERLGVRQLFTGWESGCDRLLLLIDKRFTVADILGKTALLARHPSIQFKGSAMIGLPTETPEETRTTLAVMSRMADLHPNVCFNMGVYVPFPGTPLYALALKEGFRPPPDPEGWSAFGQFNPDLPLTWLPRHSAGDRSLIRGALRYAPYLERRPRRPGENPAKYAVQNLFRALVRARFRRLDFRAPFEFALFDALRAANQRTLRI